MSDFRFRISSSALDKSSETPINTGRFTFWGNYTDEMQTRKFITYKPAKLRGKYPNWYVEYYYHKPAELIPAGAKSHWQRFKVYEDINRNNSREYAQLLVDAVNYALENGYNPFEDHTKEFREPEKIWTIQQALLYFLQKWRERGLSPASIYKYKRAVDLFNAWAPDHYPAKKVSREYIEAFLNQCKNQFNWTNRNYNNTQTLLNTAFLFLKEKKIIDDVPTHKIARMRTSTKKHKYYDEKTLAILLPLMRERDPYLYFAFQCVYYLCIRSEKELQHLKVGNIFPDRGQVFLSAGGTKTNADRYIPMPAPMLDVFKSRGILDYPSDWYVFSVASKNTFVSDSKPGQAPFGKGFFSKRFARIRKAAGLSSDFTLYGAKHTRIVHLKKDGAKDDEIMSLTGHSDFVSYSKYLRDLGVDANIDKLSELTRVI
jgi:site-specific recombinase XerD